MTTSKRLSRIHGVNCAPYESRSGRGRLSSSTTTRVRTFHFIFSILFFKFPTTTFIAGNIEASWKCEFSNRNDSQSWIHEAGPRGPDKDSAKLEGATDLCIRNPDELQLFALGWKVYGDKQATSNTNRWKIKWGAINSLERVNLSKGLNNMT